MLAERIRSEVNLVKVGAPNSRNTLSVSIGVCSSLPDDKGIEDIVRRADVALYQAKAAGRNTVKVC